MTKVFQQFYISTGAKNAMYTLRWTRFAADIHYPADSYVCVLSADLEKAQAKALEYFTAFAERISYTGPTADFELTLSDDPENENTKRRGVLSVRDTLSIEDIESGVFPFGKHVGTRIEDAPENYVLYFADRHTDREQSAVFAALTAACLGVALEKGYVAKRDERRAERHAIDSLSQHVGTVKERMIFEGEIVSVFQKAATEYDAGYSITVVRTPEGNLIDFYNNELGKVGDVVKFKATVKAHREYKGIKSTRVNRPKAV